MAKTSLDTELYILWVPFKTLGQVECPVFGACIVFYIPMCVLYTCIRAHCTRVIVRSIFFKYMGTHARYTYISQ